MRSQSIGSKKSTPRHDAALSSLVSPVPEIDRNAEGRAGSPARNDSESRQGGMENREGQIGLSAENTLQRAGGTETIGQGLAADSATVTRASGPSASLGEAAAARSSALPDRAEDIDRNKGGNGKGRRVRGLVTKDSDLMEPLL